MARLAGPTAPFPISASARCEIEASSASASLAHGSRFHASILPLDDAHELLDAPARTSSGAARICSRTMRSMLSTELVGHARSGAASAASFSRSESALRLSSSRPLSTLPRKVLERALPGQACAATKLPSTSARTLPPAALAIARAVRGPCALPCAPRAAPPSLA